MNTFRSAALCSLLALAGPALADPCAAVVDDTVAEMRAGAAGWWTADVENLVRAAGGSSCVKALSGRYSAQVETIPPAQTEAMSTAQAEPNIPAAGAAEVSRADAEPSPEEDDGSWSFGGLTFRSMSGSPGQKSYQRLRDSQNKNP